MKRGREVYLILEIICAFVACPLLSVHPGVLIPQGSSPARQPCCFPCRRWPPEDTFGEWDHWAGGGCSAPHQHPGGGKSSLSCLYPQGTWTSQLVLMGNIRSVCLKPHLGLSSRAKLCWHSMDAGTAGTGEEASKWWSVPLVLPGSQSHQKEPPPVLLHFPLKYNQIKIHK